MRQLNRQLDTLASNNNPTHLMGYDDEADVWLTTANVEGHIVCSELLSACFLCWSTGQGDGEKGKDMRTLQLLHTTRQGIIIQQRRLHQPSSIGFIKKTPKHTVYSSFII